MKGLRMAVGVPLGADGRRMIVAFILTLARANLSLEEIEETVSATCKSIPESARRHGEGTRNDVNDAAQVLTIWHGNSKYRLKGRPRPLRVRGPTPSITSLVQEVSPDLDPNTVMDQLTQADALEKLSGGRYLPRGQGVSTRGSALQKANHLRTTADILDNIDHNTAPRERWPSLFEMGAFSTKFPVSKLARWHRYVWDQADEFIRGINEYLYRAELNRDSEEPTTRVGLGVFQIQQRGVEQSQELIDVLRKVTELLQRSKPSRNSRPRFASNPTSAQGIRTHKKRLR
jgi:hypothetical protein